MIALAMMWFAIPLAASSIDLSSCDIALSEPQISAPEIAPVDWTILADTDDYVYSYDEINGAGDVIDFVNMLDADADYATLMERDTDPSILVNFEFIRVFEFFSYAFQYLDWKLEVRGCDYTGINGHSPENLKFYSSESSLGPWTEIGVLNAQTSTSFSWDVQVTTGPYFYIRVASTNQLFDGGSRNEWRLEYFRIKCIDRRSYNVGVDVDRVFDNDNLYPFRGSGTNDFYRFSCSASNEEGSDLIDYLRLYTKSEDGQYLWGMIWDNGVWSLLPWSDGVNLVISQCYTTSTSQVMTAVFAVQLTYSCDDVSNIDFTLYHESDTWSSEKTFDTTVGGKDLDQQPLLQFSGPPTMPERSDPLSTPTLSGVVSFAASGSGVAPHPSHAFVHVVRTEPTPTGEWSGGGSPDSFGNFAIPCRTMGIAGTENTFRVRIYESAALNEYIGLENYVETVSEEIVVFDYGANESSIPIGTTTFIFTKLRYFSDGSAITDATVLWNGVFLSYNPSTLRWEATLSPHSEPTTIRFDSLSVTTPEGVAALRDTPHFSVHWIRLGSFLHLSGVRTYVPVSTVYDPHSFIINVWLTDQNSALFAGWINLTIGDDKFDIYCNGVNCTSFYYYPSVAGSYSLFGSYDGDQLHTSANQTFTGLTALRRDMDFRYTVPTDMLTLVSTPSTFFNVYDNEYSGVFKGVTYIRDLPINISVSIWWTLNPDYGEPRNHAGSWNITQGAGVVSWMLPWDLDNDGVLTDDDFRCYVIILLDGLGVFEDDVIYQSVHVQQDLQIDATIPSLTYSDSTIIELEIESLYDPSYAEDLGTTIEMYISPDNETWSLIDDIYTDGSGRATIFWACDRCGLLFFRFEAKSTRFAPSRVYLQHTAEREGTRLTMLQVNSFTYSDQGVMLVLLQTDDNDALANYPVYLEILDGVWVGIGTGLTNETGYVNILWIPTLPYGIYSVRVRSPMTESLYYAGPENEVGILQVNKENLVITIDEDSGVDGHVGASVTDDEGNPVEGVPVIFYVAGNPEALGAVPTDADGHARIEVSLYGAKVIRAIVEENDYFKGSFGEMTIALPPDILTMTIILGSVFSGALIIAVTRKKRQVSVEPTPKPVSPEVRKALYEEHELIPERRREETERKIAELDEGVEDIDEP